MLQVNEMLLDGVEVHADEDMNEKSRVVDSGQRGPERAAENFICETFMKP